MSNQDVSRRRFIQGATAASVLTLAMPRKAFSANDEVTLAMIGTGGRGQALLKRITSIPGIKIAAVCDQREERAQQAASICEQYNAKVYTDFQTMLDTEKLDGCIVATEVGNHAKCVVPVLERDLHCFSEKPMDCTVEKVDQIVKAARKSKGIYQVGFQRRYAPGFQQAIKYIHDGNMGNVTFLQGQWSWTWGVGGWVADVDLSGGELVEQACHHMDVMQWVMKGQHPLRCFAIGAIKGERELPNAHNSEDHSTVAYEFPGGVILNYNHLFYCCQAFEEEKLNVHLEKGGINLITGMKYPRPDMGEPEQISEKAPDWGYGTYEELASFANHIRNNEKPLSNEETGRVSTLMSLMGRMAMYKRETKTFEPSMVTWEDLKSET